MLLVLLAVAAVAAFVWADLARTSPGPLAAVHREINRCADCHGGWFGTMTTACLKCHETIATQLDDGSGLHGTLGRARAEQCGSCHSDHHGESFQLTNRRSFAAADVPDPAQFDHARIDFAMAGKHLEQECSKCHKNAEIAILPEGGARFGGLDKGCLHCHEDKHEGRMQVACANCHGQVAFEQFAALEHPDLPLVGCHATVGCRDCHAADSSHSLERVGERRGSLARGCADCHKSPHREGFVQESCDSCHAVDHETFLDERLTVTPDQHARTGFAIAKPHETVACEKCHSGEGFAARYPGREANRCDACHTDPHRGQFTGGCVDCHSTTHFEPHEFTVARHAETSLPLTGRHTEAECNECHTIPAVDQPRRFRDTPNTCANCHGDAHEGFFDPDSACVKCHGTSSFRELTVGGFDHAARTQFVVLGAHAQDGCESCHARAETPDRFGRTFGRVEQRFGKFEGCVTCHKDPHGDSFSGKPGCADCHSQISFRALPDEFDHERWTGFVLDGAHGKASCSACHAPLRKPDADGRTSRRALGAKCADCHADPHAKQFAVKGTTDCAKCHKTTSFGDLRFHHDRDSRFRLGKQHQALACNSCHKPVRWKKREIVRYRPLGRRCGDCHMAKKKLFHREKR